MKQSLLIKNCAWRRAKLTAGILFLVSAFVALLSVVTPDAAAHGKKKKSASVESPAKERGDNNMGVGSGGKGKNMMKDHGQEKRQEEGKEKGTR